MKKNEIAEQILFDREEKNRIIKKYSTNFICISIKANIPGNNKNTYFSRFIVSYFTQNVKKLLRFKKYGKICLNGFDGYLILFIIYDFENNYENAKIIKEMTIKLEEEEMGRLVDLDVHYIGQSSLRRQNPRKCLICNEQAFICNRLKKHPESLLLKEISKIVDLKLMSIIQEMINKSIEYELNLHPKFGLITPISNGSHQDMNYNLMIKSKNYLKEAFYQFFLSGIKCENLDNLFPLLRIQGIEIENKLFEITNGVNTYKGLIFGFGIVLASSGYLLKNGDSCFNNIYIIIKKITKSLKDELYNLSKTNEMTSGIVAFKKYNIGGARLEAFNGFPSIQNVHLQDLSNFNLLKALVQLIINCDDTTTLKRARSINIYNKVKEKFINLNINNQQEINELNKYCIDHNLTFGGAADLLIIKIYLFMFEKYFFEEGEKDENKKNK